jgi:hypothetical protein
LDDETTFDHLDGDFSLRKFTFESSKLVGRASPGNLDNRQVSLAVLPLIHLVEVKIGVFNIRPVLLLFGLRFDSDCRVERVVVMGMKHAPNGIVLENSDGTRELTFDFDANKSTLTIRKPDVPATSDFTITIA